MAGFPGRLLRDPLCLLAAGFGAGCSPLAPGTLGTLVGLPVAWLLAQLPLGWAVAGIGLLFACGLPICQRAVGKLGVADHPGIVWDEIVGISVALCAVPVGVVGYGGGFLLFRLFDIWKPWPVGWLDKNIKGAAGVMLDDLAAGLLASAVLHGGLQLFPALTGPAPWAVLGAVG